MRYLAILTLLVVVVVSLNPYPNSAQALSSDAPYLYYYSAVLNAFVIERADGTDSRVFGEGLMTDDTNIVAGPGWSPSGEWFAWTSGVSNIALAPGPALKPWIVNSDGQTRLTVLDNFADAALSWSPVEDLLFVHASNQNTRGQEPFKVIHMLVDPASDAVVASVQTTPPGDFYMNDVYTSLSYDDWTFDGQHVIVEAGEPLPNNPAVWQTIFYIFDTDGNITRKVAPTTFIGDVSSTGNIAYYSPENEHTLIIENLVTSQKIAIETGDVRVWHIFWNQSGTYALAADFASLWIVDIRQHQLTAVKVDPLVPLRSYLDEFHIRWSPDGRYLLLGSGEYEGFRLYLIDVVAHSAVEIRANVLQAAWRTETSITVYEPYQMDRPRRIYVYDVLTKTVLAEILTDYNAQFSLDNHFAAYISDRLHMVDLENGTDTPFPPHRSKDENAVADGYVFWHPEMNWIISAEFSVISGGSTGKLLTGIADANSLTRRDLTACKLLANCTNWLPSQVPIQLLPPAP